MLLSRKHRKELSLGFRLTTNNRMELLAVIVALEALKKNTENVNARLEQSWLMECLDDVMQEMVEEKNRKSNFRRSEMPKNICEPVHQCTVLFISSIYLI